MIRWLSHIERRIIWRRRAWLAAAVLCTFLLLTWFDREIYLMLYVGPEREPLLQEASWYQMVRSAGYLPTWVALGLAMLLQSLRLPPRTASTGRRSLRDRAIALILVNLRNPATWSGPLIILSAGLSGLVAEIIRPRLGRLRPYQTGGLYRYHGLPDSLDIGPSFGLPSGHAAVAFGAAFMVLFLYPRAGLVAILAAIACSLSRTLAGAHFATDIFVAAVLAYPIASLVHGYYTRHFATGYQGAAYPGAGRIEAPRRSRRPLLP